MTDPTESLPGPAADDAVEAHEEKAERLVVDRHQVEGLRSGVLTLVVMVVGFGLILAWTGWENQHTEERQDATDQRLDRAVDDLSAANKRIEALVQEHQGDASRTAAKECVENHVRYEWLQQALAHVAESTGMSEAESAELRAIFPAPACDRGEAEAELTEG